jgi:hypothetical protein
LLLEGGLALVRWMRFLPRGAIRWGLVGAAVVLAGALLSARYAGSSKHWDWAVGAGVGTALGTTLLAIATFLLAYGVRRPRLSLRDDEFAVHSRVEGNTQPYLRLVVWNEEGRRAAVGTRVLVQGYRERDADTDQLTTIGSPPLGWPSALDAVDESVVIFGGSGRPLDFGRLNRVMHEPSGLLLKKVVDTNPPTRLVAHMPNAPQAVWYFRLGIGLNLTDEREWLTPGRWTVRLLVGADEADARYYDVDLEWDANARDPQAALDSVTVGVRVVT